MIKEHILKSINVKQKLSEDAVFLSKIEQIANDMVNCYNNGGKVLFCGNGGSAADAQHLAAELSGRYYIDRPSLFAEAIHVNSSYITAVANDYSYDEIYSRYISGAGKQGDMLIAISTSGNSTNIVNAVKVAKDNKMTTVAFTGDTGGQLKDLADYLLNVPSKDTPIVQESHIMIGHIICEIVEEKLFSNLKS